MRLTAFSKIFIASSCQFLASRLPASISTRRSSSPPHAILIYVSWNHGCSTCENASVRMVNTNWWTYWETERSWASYWSHSNTSWSCWGRPGSPRGMHWIVGFRACLPKLIEDLQWMVLRAKASAACQTKRLVECYSSPRSAWILPQVNEKWYCLPREYLVSPRGATSPFPRTLSQSKVSVWLQSHCIRWWSWVQTCHQQSTRID